MVVSSETPLMFLASSEYQPGFVESVFLIALKSSRSSSFCGFSRTLGSFSAFLPRWTSSVASPPSSRIMFGVPPSSHSRILWV